MKELKRNCRLNGRAVEDQKAARAAAESFNAPCADKLYRAIKLRRSPVENRL
jgi:hypothetical protein